MGDNSIIALFPEIPADQCADHCQSYQKIGQHGAASIDLTHVTSAAKPAEYADLAKELASIGYTLKPVTRATQGMRAIRCAKMRL